MLGRQHRIREKKTIDQCQSGQKRSRRPNNRSAVKIRFRSSDSFKKVLLFNIEKICKFDACL